MNDEFIFKNGFLKHGNKIVNINNLECIEFYISGYEKFTVGLNFSNECGIKYNFKTESEAKEFFENVFSVLSDDQKTISKVGC